MLIFIVPRGEEVKLKCNYNVLRIRGGEEHRNSESQYGSETSGAVNGGDKNVYFVPGAPLNSGVSEASLCHC